ncbi:hypothetical protein CEXT_612381 [Caerostris extrusa]|uniref:Uncharacterized protein n=1 Tax=Caerostris extrusa TaxID=172846 RepID=A0AAV4WB39_CAEEX|nr:hypothetical protein CEXT_612381 [Caerostris extrusa]
MQRRLRSTRVPTASNFRRPPPPVTSCMREPSEECASNHVKTVNRLRPNFTASGQLGSNGQNSIQTPSCSQLVTSSFQHPK